MRAAASFVAFPVGPILGGWLLTHFWWGWVFLINMPIVVVALAAVVVLVPESRASKPPGLDLFGVAVSAAGRVGSSILTYGLIKAGQEGWANVDALIMMVGGVAVLVGFFAWERRLTGRPGGQPLLDLALFGSASFTWGVILAMLPIVAMLGILFTMPQYFQGVLGMNALGSGLRLLPLVAGLLLGAIPAARVVYVVGAKLAVAAGFVLLTVGLFLGSMMSVGSSGPLRGGVDVGRRARDRHRHGDRHVRRAVELSEEKSGVGSGVMQAVNKTGAPLGIAILGSVLSAGYLARLKLVGLPATAVAAIRQSVFGGVAVAHQIHSPASSYVSAPSLRARDGSGTPGLSWRRPDRRCSHRLFPPSDECEEAAGPRNRDGRRKVRQTAGDRRPGCVRPKGRRRP